MSKAKWTFTNLAAHSADPNATPPTQDKILSIPRSPTGADSIWMAAKTASPSVKIWLQIGTRWVPLAQTIGGGATTYALSADAMDVFPPGSIPTNSVLYLQVTVVNGCTEIAVGTTNS